MEGYVSRSRIDRWADLGCFGCNGTNDLETPMQFPFGSGWEKWREENWLWRAQALSILEAVSLFGSDGLHRVNRGSSERGRDRGEKCDSGEQQRSPH